ncbi:MAG: glycosyltransferase [Prochlorococcaceae cyanobacterium]|jgi:UDP-N-acetylglucosamine transferase subunit ALG13
MILVTVGTEKFPFDRLMHWIDQLLEADLLGEEVVVQYGTCTVLPAGAKVYRMVREADFRSLIEQARVVVAHCGEGTVLLLDAMDTPFILVPRSQRYREHVDDHQVELAHAMASMGVPIAWGPADLVRFCAEPRKLSISDLSVAAARAVCRRLEERFPAGGRP